MSDRSETHFGIRFCHIPAGPFRMGSDEGDPDERPVHEVDLDEFWLAETPLSWSDYNRLLGWEPPPNARGDGFNQYLEAEIRMLYCEDHTHRAQRLRDTLPDRRTFESKPMVAVSPFDVRPLCEKLSTEERELRLPTEAQWEKAARGGLIGQPYPWGSEPPSPENCDFHRYESFSILPSRTFPPNGYGLYAMSGGVWEWTSTPYDALAYRGEETPAGVSQAVIRGGSWADCADAVTVSFRASQRAVAGLTANVGVRLCLVDPRRAQPAHWFDDPAGVSE